MNMLNEVIGQQQAKTELEFRLNNHINTKGAFPNLLLTGSKGDGKSHLARKIGKNLPDFSDGSRDYKAFFTINGSALKNLRVFFEQYCSQFADGDKYCTVFIDEAHEIKKPVQAALLSVLENTKTNRNVYEYEDIPYYFDFRKVTFIFATTDEDKLVEPLIDRLLKITLSPYTPDELAEIINGVVGEAMEFDKGVLEKASQYVRRNARKADQLAKDILSLGVPVFKMIHLKKLIEKTNLAPMGLDLDEIRTLRILEECASSDGLSLGQLASRMGRPGRSMQKGVEPYLLANNLMEIDGKRRITAKGREYLKNLA